ncbi:MAG: hypothetical protein DI570_09335 [Phenylobacterium zucineum]|nr:MAG: hypothetical protein DI570_09335 [Phenylobacterium zucineum]
MKLRHFDTQGRFWTPAWDVARKQPMTVEAVQLADGSWHEFPSFVSRREAGELYLADFMRRRGLRMDYTR